MHTYECLFFLRGAINYHTKDSRVACWNLILAAPAGQCLNAAATSKRPASIGILIKTANIFHGATVTVLGPLFSP